MNKLAAEFPGTFWLVLGGCGSAVFAAAFPGVGIGLLGVALAFAVGHVSGGHFNPAVTLGSFPQAASRRAMQLATSPCRYWA